MYTIRYTQWPSILSGPGHRPGWLLVAALSLSACSAQGRNFTERTVHDASVAGDPDANALRAEDANALRAEDANALHAEDANALHAEDANALRAEDASHDVATEPGAEAGIAIADAGSGFSCTPNPCQNRGECSTVDGACRCAAGFSGVYCESRDECASAPCQNGGVCTDDDGGTTCACPPGFSGLRCERQVRRCVDMPCENGATCADGENGYVCTCKPGFTGNNCETNIDDCASNPCQNGGICVDGIASYSCQCDNRHTGTRCEYLQAALSGLVDDEVALVAGLSRDGRVAVLNTFTHIGAHQRALVMKDMRAPEVLELPSSQRFEAFGIDQDGATIVGQAEQLPYAVSGASFRCLRRKDSSSGLARDSSRDGTTIVGFWIDAYADRVAARFFLGGVELFKTPLGDETSSEAVAVSGDGAIIAGKSRLESGLYRVWRWVVSTGQRVNVDSPAGSTSPEVRDLSTDGRVLVGSVKVNDVRRAVRWVGDSGNAEELWAGQAWGTNVDGTVIVGDDGNNNAVVWTPTSGVRTVASALAANPDLRNATLTVAKAVSDDGNVIAGDATVGTSSQVWVARLR